jgi:hypothetical protein
MPKNHVMVVKPKLNKPAISYCVVCDALPDECDHDGPRYLDPIVYENATAGWRVPDRERDRWNNHRWSNPPRPNANPETIPGIQRLIVQLEDWMEISPALEFTIRAKYEINPVRTCRICEHVIDRAKAGKSTNPPGLLTVRLQEIT